MTTPRWIAAVHHLALRAYPPPFRRRLGDDLQQTFLARSSARRQDRRRAAWAADLFDLVDTVASGLAERRASNREYSPSSLQQRTLTMTWDSIRHDLRTALRQLRLAPTFSALIIATLAIGIGANAAIFAAVHAVLLQPLPYERPEQLVSVWSNNTKGGDPVYPVSPANFDAFARESTAFTHVEAMYSFLNNERVTTGDSSEVLQASWVTGGMFGMLGRPALLGRGLQPGDEDAVVLSHAYWLRRFGGATDVIGRTLPRPGGLPPLAIVGVMPADFVFPYRSMLAPSGFARVQQPDLWRLLTPQTGFRMLDAAGQPTRTIHHLAVVARLAPGRQLEDARRDLGAIAEQRERQLPDSNDGFGVTVRTLNEQTVGSLRPSLVLLSGIVGVLLLLMCVNLANVLLARATVKQRDSAVRAALGATRARLLQQALVQNVTLATMGGLVAVALVTVGARVLPALAPADLPRLSETHVSAPVVVFTLGLAIVTGLLAGLLPAFATARAKAADGLRSSTRTTAGRTQRVTRNTLVVAEIALAALLTVGAGLLLRSFISVLAVDPGFRPQHLLTFQVAVPPAYADTDGNLIRFYDELREKLSAIPGVEGIGGSTRIPLGSTQVSTALSVEGRDVPPADLPEVQMRRSVHDYFGTMQIPVLEGRVFTDDDRRAPELLAVINRALAAEVFPGESAIGRRVQLGGGTRPESWMRVIGVVGNVRHTSLEETPEPEIYISHLQGAPSSPFMVVRTAGDPAVVTSAVRDAVRSLGAEPPSNVHTMEDLRRQSVGERRFLVWLTAGFGVVALLLAGIGVYGVIALIVSERTAEVGVRLALGASPRDVWSMLVGQAAGLASIGVAIGLLAGGLLSPLASGLLFGVTPFDPVTFGAVAAVLIGIGVAAAAIPARRAMAIDPARALRAQ